MKIHVPFSFIVPAFLALAILNLQPDAASAQGTAFTYQGQLQNSNGPVHGAYNFTFSLYTNSTGGAIAAGPVTNNGVAVTNGLFTVTIDFGSGIWNGQTNWLQIGVESNSVTSFATLLPRQEVTPTPYAIFAEGGNAAGLSGTVKNSQLASNTITINAGTGLSGGGTVALGGSTTLNNSGVTSLTGGDGVTASASSGSVTLGLGGTLTLPTLPVNINAGPYLLLFANAVDQNFGVGPSAGNLSMSGAYNTAVGFQPMEFAGSGSYDTAVGAAALEYVQGGSFNTAAGAFALFVNDTNNNTAVGYAALYQDFTGNNDTAVGFEALENNPSDIGLVAVGYQALQNDNAFYALSPGGQNTAIGYQALKSDTNGVENTAEGYQALWLNTSGSFNTAQGENALYSNTSGEENTANGCEALQANSSGQANTAEGQGALSFNTTGGGNTAGGAQTLFGNTTGNNNTAYGQAALYFGNGNNNTVVGSDADYGNLTGDGNTVVGYSAYDSLDVTSFAMNRNTAVGAFSLENITDGSYNTVLGWGADENVTNGIENIAIGYEAGNNLLYGSSNIVIGNFGQATDNNVIRIGVQGIQNDTVIAGIYGATLPGGEGATAVYVDDAGHLGTMTSSAKYKRDIQPMGDASDVLLKLHPVTFKYKPDIDPKGARQFGLVAEDVDQIDPELVVRDQNHRIYSVRYEAVNAMLLNEFLKQHQTVENQNAQLQNQSAEIDDLKKQNVSLAQRLDELEQTVKALAAAPLAVTRSSKIEDGR